jgi:hypothetical protein
VNAIPTFKVSGVVAPCKTGGDNPTNYFIVAANDRDLLLVMTQLGFRDVKAESFRAADVFMGTTPVQTQPATEPAPVPAKPAPVKKPARTKGGRK